MLESNLNNKSLLTINQSLSDKIILSQLINDLITNIPPSSSAAENVVVPDDES